MAVRFKWNIPGFYQLRSEPGVVAYLETYAQQVADRANEMGQGTYAVGSVQGMKRPQGRWRTSVITADARAMANNAKNNTLIKALGGG